ncbi:MAG: AraC family transcriptional regulator [Myxococcota bacterium]
METERSVEDALREVLRSFRLETSVMSRAHLGSPWAVSTQGLPGAIFHAVVEGECHLRPDNGPAPLCLGPGDVALLTRGDPHVLSDGGGSIPAPLGQLAMRNDGRCVETLEYGGSGEQTRIICGSFALRHAGGDVMLSALPPVMHARGRGSGGVGAWLDTTIDMLAHELDRRSPGAEIMVARLTDVLVIHLLRACVEQAPERGGGWLSALRDERIGRAIATMHHDPGGKWTASSLASRAGMSRSSFFARFSELVGESPARYLARWRMWVAADLLAQQSLSLGELAERVGYSSEDAFSRVFKKVIGVSPVQYRRDGVASVLH